MTKEEKRLIDAVMKRFGELVSEFGSVAKVLKACKDQNSRQSIHEICKACAALQSKQRRK
jgi:hypothetical protein